GHLDRRVHETRQMAVLAVAPVAIGPGTAAAALDIGVDETRAAGRVAAAETAGTDLTVGAGGDPLRHRLRQCPEHGFDNLLRAVGARRYRAGRQRVNDAAGP